MTGRSGRSLFLVLFAFLAIGIGGLSLSLGEPVRRALSVAASHAAWAIRVATLAVGQAIPWALLVVVFALTALSAMGKGAGSRPRARRKAAPALRSRAAVWDSRIALGKQSVFLRRPLESELRRLAAQVLSGAESADDADAGFLLERAGADVPDAVRRLLAPADDRNQAAPLFGGRKAKAESAAAYGRWLDEVVGYLEQKMGDAGGNAH